MHVAVAAWGSPAIIVAEYSSDNAVLFKEYMYVDLALVFG